MSPPEGASPAVERAIGRDSVETVAFKVFAYASLMGTGILLARRLGPEGAGVLAVLLALLQTLEQAGNLGLPTANVYFLAKRPDRAAAVAGNAVVAPLLVGATLALVLFAARGFVADTFLGGANGGLVVVVLWLLPFRFLESNLYSLLRGARRFRLWNLFQAASPALDFAALFVTIGLLGGGVAAAVAVRTALGTAQCLVLFLVVRRAVPVSLGLDRPLLRETFSFGLKTYLQVLASYLHHKVDVWFIAALVGTADVAYYAAAVGYTTLAWFVPDSIGLVLLPRLVTLERREIHRLVAFATRCAFFVLALACAASVLLAPLLVPFLYGARFAPAVPVVPILAIGILTMSVGKILFRNFTSQARQTVNVVAGAVSLGANVLLNCLLVPAFGIAGAAAATAVSYTLSSSILLARFRKDSGLPLAAVFVPTSEDLSAFFSALAPKLSPFRRKARAGLSRR